VLGVGEIARLTFYQWVDLEQCPLKGMISTLELDGLLPEPIPTRAALIGRFHHRAMELAATIRDPSELEVRIEEEIAKLQTTVNRWPHLKRAGSASGWDEVNKSAVLATRIVSARSPGGEVGALAVEKELQSKDGRLVGRPDYFSVTKGRALLGEYKSGAIRDSSGQPVPVHTDQLRFYSVLIFDNFDVTHVSARVESLSGDAYQIEIEPEAAKGFRARVDRVLGDINAGLRASRDSGVFARPSKEACRSCDAQIVCTKFKQEQDRLDLEGEQFLIEGLVTQVVHNGTVTEVTIVDEYRKSTVTLAVPTNAAMELSPRGRFVFLNVRRHGAALAWGHSSRVFSYG
jgi:PD-(D/E)XK nuclease superfamily